MPSGQLSPKLNHLLIHSSGIGERIGRVKEGKLVGQGKDILTGEERKENRK